jgi:hypothetical protein
MRALLAHLPTRASFVRACAGIRKVIRGGRAAASVLCFAFRADAVAQRPTRSAKARPQLESGPFALGRGSTTRLRRGLSGFGERSPWLVRRRWYTADHAESDSWPIGAGV